MRKDNLLMDMTDNVIDLSQARVALQTGGTSIDENWLKALSPGAVFLCERKDMPKQPMKHLVKDLYCVLAHKELHANLMQRLPDGRQADFWFNTLEFSRANLLGEIIAQVDPTGVISEEEQEAPKKETDNDGDRSV